MREKGFHDLFYFALHTGCRLGEVEGLQRGDIDYKEKMLTIQRKLNAKTGKVEDWLKMNKGPRYIPVHSGLQNVLARYRFKTETAFVFDRHARDTVREHLIRNAKAAGVAPLKFH